MLILRGQGQISTFDIMLKYVPCLIKCFLQNEKILIFGEMVAAQRLLGFALYRKIPIYKKRTQFFT